MNGNPRHLHTHLATSEQQCECCEETHKIFNCGKLKKLSVRELAELIKVRKLCFNCLRPGHRSEDCVGSKCKQCGRKHHTLLHRENIHNRNTNQQTTSGTSSTQANDKQKNNAKLQNFRMNNAKLKNNAKLQNYSNNSNRKI